MPDFIDIADIPKRITLGQCYSPLDFVSPFLTLEITYSHAAWTHPHEWKISNLLSSNPNLASHEFAVIFTCSWPNFDSR